MAQISKMQKIKKPKQKKGNPIKHAKPWWFAVAAVPVVLLVVVLCFQFNIIGSRRQQQAEARQEVLTLGSYVPFETLGKDVFLPNDAAEEESVYGNSYSMLRVSRFEESGNPRYAIGVIAIPNESNVPYDFGNNYLEVVDLVESMVGQAVAGVWSGIHPNFSVNLNKRTLFGNIDAIEEYGTASIGVAYLAIDGDENTPDEQRNISFQEEPYTIKVYMDTILVNNRPVVAWGAWDQAVSVGQANIRQSVVDALASILEVDTQDMSGESLETVNSDETLLIYEATTGRWINDITGEYVPEVPPIDDPEFHDKWWAYICKVKGYDSTMMGDMDEMDHDHGEEIESEGSEPADGEVDHSMHNHAGDESTE